MTKQFIARRIERPAEILSLLKHFDRKHRRIAFRSLETSAGLSDHLVGGRRMDEGMSSPVPWGLKVITRIVRQQPVTDKRAEDYQRWYQP
jgi:hypothetical protein